MTETPTLAELRTILGDLGLGEPVAVTELAGGSNKAFRIDLADGAAVVLKTYDDLGATLPASEAYASRLLAGLDMPVTHYLAVDESLTRLPFRFALTNHLPGVTAASLRDDPGIADVYRQMGVLLRRLHAVHLLAFGHFDATGIHDPVPDNAISMQRTAAHAFAQFRKYGGDPALADRLARIVAARAELFAQSGGPVFAHDDFHVGNILSERDADGHLRLTGLIDFGNARAADAVSDLAKTLFMADHDAPGASAHIRAGYGPVGHPDPEAALWLYTLLHRVVMWWCLRRVGAIADGVHDPLIADLSQMAKEGGP